MIQDEYVNLDVDSDFGGPRSYEWLRDTADLCFNPSDGDGAEEELYAQVMVAAATFIESQPCTCTNSDPDSSADTSVPYDDGDQCKRCEVLGRYFDRRVDR